MMKETLTESSLIAFSPLRLRDNPLLTRYLRSFPSQLSAYSIPSLFIWQDFFHYYWARVEDHLCLFAEYDGNFYMPLPPLGNGFSQHAVEASFALMDRLNANPAVSRIENVGEETVRFFEAMDLQVRFSSCEYLYRTQTLLNLQGNSYKSKRWAINHFLKHYRSSFEEYQPGDLLACMELFDDWKAMRNAKFKDTYYWALMEDTALAHCRAIEHTQDLGLVGRVVRIDGRVRGYTFGFELRPQLFCILLEVTDLRIKGLAQYLFWRFCQDLKGYAYINVLDDSGLENIRRVKESYHPEKLVPAYTAYRT